MCIYCLKNLSTTQGDHIFAREFFLKTKRDNLPKVPACKCCNDEKSELEHYLTTVLPFGGQHPDSRINLQNMVPPRLAKNEKLRDELERSKKTIWKQNKSGVYLPGVSALPFNGGRLESLSCYIVQGLLWHHWRVTLTSDHVLIPACLNMAGEAFLERLLSMRAANRVDNNLGDGTFFYRGCQGTDYPEFSIWELSIYGGLELADSVGAPREKSSKVGVFTGHESKLRQILAPFLCHKS